MPYIWMVFGVCCLLYFLFLMARQVDFGWIWGPAGLLFLGMGIGLWYERIHPGSRLLSLPVRTGLGLAIVAAVLAFGIVEAQIFREMQKEPEQGLDYLIVLGAQVKGTRPSKALRKRLEAAQEYLEQNPETKAVLSGGRGEGEEITEAQCMQEYLLQAGISPERLLLEDASTTTEENLRFCAVCIDEDQAAQKSAKDSAGVLSGNCALRIGLLSNNFHVYRARKYAEHMGYSHICTIAAPSDWKLQAHYLVREFFALVKGAMDGELKLL